MALWRCDTEPAECESALAWAKTQQAAFEAQYAGFWTDLDVMQAWASAEPQLAGILVVCMVCAAYLVIGAIRAIRRIHTQQTPGLPRTVPAALFVVAALTLAIPYVASPGRVPTPWW